MPLKPSETLEILRSIGHKPQKKLGQNFLIDGNIARKSLSMIEVSNQTPIVEIGPGLGTLTQSLLERGNPVYAVEIDARLHAYLKSKMEFWINKKQLILTNADAVKLPTGMLPQITKEFIVVANLPYAISSPWLEAVLTQKNIPLSMTLMLQKEAADRMWANTKTKNYNALSIFIQSAFSRSTCHAVSCNCFFPKPAVDSVLIHMKKLSNNFIFPDKSRKFIRQIFTKRRKQMGVLIKGETPSLQENLNKWLSKSKIAPSKRPEEIEIKYWQDLSLMIEQ